MWPGTYKRGRCKKCLPFSFLPAPFVDPSPASLVRPAFQAVQSFSKNVRVTSLCFDWKAQVAPGSSGGRGARGRRQTSGKLASTSKLFAVGRCTASAVHTPQSQNIESHAAHAHHMPALRLGTNAQKKTCRLVSEQGEAGRLKLKLPMACARTGCKANNGQ